MLFDNLLENIGNGIFQRFVITVCGLATLAESLAVTSVPFAMTLAACDLHLTIAEGNWLNVTLITGILIGGYWLGGLADVSGRKYILSTTSILTFIGCFVASFSQSIVMLFVSLIVLGIGIGGNHSSTRLFVIEIIPASSRGRKWMILEIYAAVGHILAIVFSWLLVPSLESQTKHDYVRLKSWRILFGLSGSLSIFSACMMSVFPASPRWLLSKKLDEESLEVMRKIYALNKMKHEDSFPNVRLDHLYYVHVDIENINYQCSSQLIRTFRCLKVYTRHLFKKYLKIVILFMIISFCSFEGGVMLNLWMCLNLQHDDIHNCSLSGAVLYVQGTNYTTYCASDTLVSAFKTSAFLSVNALGILLPVLMVELLRRNILLCVCYLLAGAACLSSIVIPSGDVIIFSQIAFLALGFISEGILRLMILESFPTILRGTAYGFIKVWARLHLIFLILLLQAPCFWSFVAITILFVIAGISACFLPSHTKKSMED